MEKGVDAHYRCAHGLGQAGQREHQDVQNGSNVLYSVSVHTWGGATLAFRWGKTHQKGMTCHALLNSFPVFDTKKEGEGVIASTPLGS